MFSYSRFKGTLSQIIHAAYLIVCFPVLVRTFLRKGFVSMHTWYGGEKERRMEQGKQEKGQKGRLQ